MRLGATLTASQPTDTIVTAALDNYVFPDFPAMLWSGDAGLTFATRAESMQVPAVARARNIICGTIGSLPLERYSAMTGKHLSSSPLLYQPDPNSPRPVTYAWLAESIWLYGIGYLQVLEQYAEDGRPSRARWIDPLRVSPILDSTGLMVIGYEVDATRVPDAGVGSLIAFPGIDEGLLRRAGKTIKTASELESAAYRAAQEPTPTLALKNTGVDLPSDKVAELSARWKQMRRERATAYLMPGLDLQVIGFDPKSQQLVEARQFMASELARACGIPAWYLNAETASMTYSNTEQERRTLVDFSLRPILSAIEARLSMPDVMPRAIEVRFDLDDFMRGNATERLDNTIKMLDAGLITLEQAQAREDLSPEGSN